jgi:hypothetical protein
MSSTATISLVDSDWSCDAAVDERPHYIAKRVTSSSIASSRLQLLPSHPQPVGQQPRSWLPLPQPESPPLQPDSLPRPLDSLRHWLVGPRLPRDLALAAVSLHIPRSRLPAVRLLPPLSSFVHKTTWCLLLAQTIDPSPIRCQRRKQKRGQDTLLRRPVSEPEALWYWALSTCLSYCHHKAKRWEDSLPRVPYAVSAVPVIACRV